MIEVNLIKASTVRIIVCSLVLVYPHGDMCKCD